MVRKSFLGRPVSPPIQCRNSDRLQSVKICCLYPKNICTNKVNFVNIVHVCILIFRISCTRKLILKVMLVLKRTFKIGKRSRMTAGNSWCGPMRAINRPCRCVMGYISASVQGQPRGSTFLIYL